MSEHVSVQLLNKHGHVRKLKDLETEIIRLAIAHYKGQMSEVARRLGMGRSTLYRKLGDVEDHIKNLEVEQPTELDLVQVTEPV